MTHSSFGFLAASHTTVSACKSSLQLSLRWFCAVGLGRCRPPYFSAVSSLTSTEIIGASLVLSFPLFVVSVLLDISGDWPTWDGPCGLEHLYFCRLSSLQLNGIDRTCYAVTPSMIIWPIVRLLPSFTLMKFIHSGVHLCPILHFLSRFDILVTKRCQNASNMTHLYYYCWISSSFYTFFSYILQFSWRS